MAKFGADAAAQTLTRLLKMKKEIDLAARAISLPPSLIAAIISRETAALSTYCQPPPVGRLGDGGHGHGPMQIDDRSFPEWCADWRAGKLSLADGIKQGCFVLRQKQIALGKLVPEMPEHLRRQAACAAYNCGEGNVRKAFRSGKDLDAYTTHKNYGKDVVERAAYFLTHGFPD